VRVFAVSDIHIDYPENRRWLSSLSRDEYRQDVLILAGDVSDDPGLLAEAFEMTAGRFATVLFVPGNHDLWVRGNGHGDSLARLAYIRQLAAETGIVMEPVQFDSLTIIPLFSWYDFSFGAPTPELRRAWLDFSACKWPAGFDETAITRHFLAMNEPFLHLTNDTVITFSHFLPRIDLMPLIIPPHKRGVYPVLGTPRLEQQIRRLGAAIHIYGHSHINMRNFKDNTVYINNAFGYPHEERGVAKQLICVWEQSANDD